MKLLTALTLASLVTSPISAEQVQHPQRTIDYTFFYAQRENPFAPAGVETPLPPTPTYEQVRSSYDTQKWQELWNGAKLQRVDVYRQGEKVDTIAMVRFDPNKTKMRIISGCPSPTQECDYKLIEEWRAHPQYKNEDNIVLVNSSYYIYGTSPHGQPETFFIRNGEHFGTPRNKNRGMLIETLEGKLDLLDSNYTARSTFSHPQTQWAVQSWPVLKDKEGGIRVRNSQWQANRSITAKDKQGNIYVMTTEGGFFTLYNMGRFLKDLSKQGLEIETAMNLDGGYEGDMFIDTPTFTYLSTGHFETQGPEANISWEVGARIKIPTVLAFVPK